MMNKTIVALYDDIAVARQVIEDLVKADYDRSAISLITNDAHNQYSHYLDKNYVAQDDAVPASEGAGFGAVVGVLTGVLVGLGALVIPGIGLAIAAGPIVAGLTGAVAGAVTGGIVGALVKTGVPEDEAPYYAEGIRRGGTMISVETSDTLRAGDILHRHGSVNIHERINLWRQEGWHGFNTDTVENQDTVKSVPDIAVAARTTVTPDEASITSATPITIVPVVSVVEKPPQIDEADAKFIPVMGTLATIDPATPVIPGSDAIPVEPVVMVVENDLRNESNQQPQQDDFEDRESLTELSEG